MTTIAPPIVRPSSAADVATVCALLKEAQLPTEDLASAADLRLWVLEDDERVVGAIGLERFGSSALLRSLVVSPAVRGRSLGHTLVSALEREARASGVATLLLLTHTAELFFKRLGYTVVDRAHAPEDIRQSAEFLSLCPASAVCMSKTLASLPGPGHGR